MRKTNIADKRDELIKRLSRGYKQRVGLAQALVHDPDVIILDEPTVGLDPKQIIEVRHLIKGLAGSHTIILSTHILPEVSMTCDRVVIINKGKIAAVDTPQNLTSQLKGGQRIRVEVQAPENSLAATCSRRFPGAHACRSEPARARRARRCDCRSRARARTFAARSPRKSSKKAGRFIELRGVNLSLEEIFLQLTTEDAAHAQASRTKSGARHRK